MFLSIGFKGLKGEWKGIFCTLQPIFECKGSANRRQYKTKSFFFVVIVEMQPTFNAKKVSGFWFLVSGF